MTWTYARRCRFEAMYYRTGLHVAISKKNSLYSMHTAKGFIPAACKLILSRDPSIPGGSNVIISRQDTIEASAILLCRASGKFADAKVDDLYAILRKKTTSVACIVYGGAPVAS